MKWITFKLCRLTDFVNCYFGNEGACKNPKHVKSGSF